ncbi:MAG: phosphoribosylformylglycinamidine synthase-associated small membrane protein [Hyphomicrobiaceae bacterium]
MHHPTSSEAKRTCVPPPRSDDGLQAVRFMAIKAGLFILIPLAASLIAAWWMLG